MNGTHFKLATFAKPGGSPFAAIVLGDDAVDLSAAHAAYRASGHSGALSATDTISGLLESWEANLPVLQEIVAFLEKAGLHPGTAELASLRALPPVTRPGKMFYAAQNFQEHVDEMIRAGMTPAGGPRFTGEKSTTVPYLFLKAPSCLAGAFDEIELPLGMKKIDWEAPNILDASR
jgi:2-keto-4-pentenoate hydratase/2-oxohepta-3-ene-1,7-dioic acid hydratase in catechol pathway